MALAFMPTTQPVFRARPERCEPRYYRSNDTLFTFVPDGTALVRRDDPDGPRYGQRVHWESIGGRAELVPNDYPPDFPRLSLAQSA